MKLSTGTKDDRECRRLWPEVVRRYQDMEAEWERLLTAESLTAARASQLAAGWVAWIVAGHSLDMGGETSDVFEPMSLPEARTPERIARMWDRVEAHADEALKLAAVAIQEDTRKHLLDAMLPAAAGAYLQADLTGLGATGAHRALNPLRAAQDGLPLVPAAAPPHDPSLSLKALLDAWRAMTAVKPRTITETEYVVDMLAEFVGHTDARRVTREDFRRWREASKATPEGITNTTWNNRLSLVRQVFAFAVKDGRLDLNPADNALRLDKSRVTTRLPYSDEDAVRILTAARAETSPARRWAHWVMAFSGMRVGEVLQLTAGDLRREGAVWFLAVHEDDEGKSVKTGQRRNVPLHPALIKEGFLAYAQTVTGDAPLFPDKGLDKHGNRGGRGWNHVGKWVRDVAGVVDPRKAPNHSWRHRAEDELRAAEVIQDARDAILGHARRTTGRSYGVRGEALARLLRELSKLPVPVGLEVGRKGK